MNGKKMNCVCCTDWNFQRWREVKDNYGIKFVCPYCVRFYGYLPKGLKNKKEKNYVIRGS